MDKWSFKDLMFYCTICVGITCFTFLVGLWSVQGHESYLETIKQQEKFIAAGYVQCAEIDTGNTIQLIWKKSESECHIIK